MAVGGCKELRQLPLSLRVGVLDRHTEEVAILATRSESRIVGPDRSGSLTTV